MEEINTRIKNEISHQSLQELADEKLMPEYKQCISVQTQIKKLADVLDKYIDHDVKQQIIDEYMMQLVPPGTKAAIRGNKFNFMVKNVINELQLDTARFEICFEKKCISHVTSEIPDWYILEKSTDKIIIGMNQLDLWGGGHQINRGSKYIENNTHNTEKSKLLCVVCNEIRFTTTKSKIYKLFEIGFRENTLCYLNNLHNIIQSYFATND
jgi:hypothetical protein